MIITQQPGLSLFFLSIASWHLFSLLLRDSKKRKKRAGVTGRGKKGYDQLVGQTPLVELSHLSALLMRRVLAKVESTNPGGTGKDRAVQHMLDEAEARGVLRPGMTVFEGSSGSTGIAIAFQCLARGYACHIVMPDDQAEEKRRLLRTLGAQVTVVPCCAIANQEHYVNTARRLAEELQGFFVNQFENEANYRVHYEHTGPEIWQQTEGELQAFVMSSGTGGTIAGVSRFLKEMNPSIRVVLADPTGSSLCNKVRHNVCYTSQQSERRIRKHRYDSIVEGVGLDRITANFSAALIDEAYSSSDQEVVEMAHALLRLEGLFVGSSSALNLSVACRVAASLPEGSTVVTVICDNGSRHLSRLWSEDYIVQEAGLRWPLGGGGEEDQDHWRKIILRYVDGSKRANE